MRPRRYAVVPTHNRPVELTTAVRSIAPQCDALVVIDNASTPAVDREALLPNVALHRTGPVDTVVLRDEEQPPNLSRLWNLGLDWCAARARMDGHDTWDVAILNDDAIPPPRWFERVSYAMRIRDAAAASSHPFAPVEEGPRVDFHGPDGPPGVHNRLTGWAFILRGEAGLRFDERLRWWCGDDHMSWQARRNGGLVHLGGVPVANTLANASTTGVLAEQAAKDMQTFVDITGVRPW
jgi:glycosyltransferase involved in cell wall biosynthesis